jgi:ELWxxDGT repeat protein
MLLRHFGRGSIIFREGDRSQTLYMVKSGAVRIFAHSLNGNETTLILCSQPGDVFGELAAIDGGPRSVTAAALCPTRLYALSSEALSLTVVGNEFFFVADDGIHGAELWQSKGTVTTTVMIQDIAPGSTSAGPMGIRLVGSFICAG